MNCPPEFADLHAVHNPVIEGAGQRQDGPNDNFAASHDRLLFHLPHNDDRRDFRGGEERCHAGSEAETADVGNDERTKTVGR